MNDQSERGLFELDIRKTETLETNFGGGDDKAVIVDDVLDRIALDLDGGDGVDTLDLGQAGSGARVDLAAGVVDGAWAVNFENVAGTAFQDTIVGSDANHALHGGDGNDWIAGGAGNDRINGGDGNDVLHGGDSKDILRGQDGSDRLFGGAGDDRLEGGGSGFNILDGGDGNDRMFGGNGDGELFGGAGNDRMDGQQGDDLLNGGAGNDVLTGGSGADTFLFAFEDEGVDVITDFEFGVDKLAFATSDPSVTAETLLAGASQVGNDVELALSKKVITIQDAQVTDFSADDFLLA